MKNKIIRPITVYPASQQGKRPSNEDVEVTINNLNEYGLAIDKKYAPIDIFIICDGHNGKQVSTYIAEQLARKFMNKTMNYPIGKKMVKDIYDKIQLDLIKNVSTSNIAGSTAITLIRYNYLGKEKIQIFNVGDCRAVMCKDGLAIPLTKDHKPHWPEETERLKNIITLYNLPDKIGFYDGDWRIHGLSVSRSFGDIDSTPYITHQPDSFSYILSAKDKFIILACDGLWDVMENHEAVNFVLEKIKYGDARENIALQLAKRAIDKGSTDNVSVVIIKFNQ